MVESIEFRRGLFDGVQKRGFAAWAMHHIPLGRVGAGMGAQVIGANTGGVEYLLINFGSLKGHSVLHQR